MFCPKCGSTLPDGSAFCGNCGAQLPSNVAVPIAAHSPYPQSPAIVAQGVDAVASVAPAKPANKAIVIAIVAVVVVVGLVVAGFFVARSFGVFGVMPKATVNEYSWNDLSRISQEISKASDEDAAIEIAKKYNLVTQDGKLDGTQVKTVQLSDGTTAAVQIAGFLHDDRTDGGKAGITFIFQDAIAKRSMNSSSTNRGGWESSQMRSWLASDGIAMLPQDLSSKIVAVNKKTNNTGETKSSSSVTNTSDRLWLFSATELCGTISWYSSSSYNSVHNAEGSEYQLFRNSGISKDGSNSILVKRYGGSSCTWWERSPGPTRSTTFDDVSGSGNPGTDAESASYTNGVVPGFCL